MSAWYNDRPAREVVYQAIKYQQRDGWSHRDVLRLSHPKPPSVQHKEIYHWITEGWDGVGDIPHPDEALQQIWAFERVKRATTAEEVASLIREYRLLREAVPTQWLKSAPVWEALLTDIPMTALIRNLATLTRLGLLTPLSEITQRVTAQLTAGKWLRQARVHPITVLSALKTYAQGHGDRGKQAWQPVASVVDALDAAFYASFGNVLPTHKRWVLALDVSGSMGYGTIAGTPGLTPRIASAAMALITASVEPCTSIVAFSTELIPVTISPHQRLDDVIRMLQGIPMGGTDCALPMLWALEHQVATDVFAIYTDSETWYGQIHPVQALQHYRAQMGIPAKLVVVGMLANAFSIADPDDPGMLDCVGFDVATPQVISDFATDFLLGASQPLSVYDLERE
jgi:60 kDa SS-A/Ro ribonucleoprotein